MSNVRLQFNKIISRIESAIKDTVSNKEKKKVAEFALNVVVKRTRLGYGVKENFGKKEKLAKLKDSYVDKRKKFTGLSSLTRPKKSNLTRTGSMLDSMKAKFQGKTIVIAPTGKRNIEAALGNSQDVTYSNGYTKPARVFNRVSQLEFNQIKRFYRKTFGDLLKNRKLIK